MLEEWNQTRRNADHLTGSDVDVAHILGPDENKIAAVPGDDVVPLDPAVDDGRIGRRERRIVLLVGPQPDDIISEPALRHLPVGGDEEAVGIDPRVNREARDQADVRAFGRLDRADPAVVGDMDVAHLETGPLAIQAARSERREPAFVGEH